METRPHAVRRWGILWAQARAKAPLPENPTVAERSIQGAAAASFTVLGKVGSGSRAGDRNVQSRDGRGQSVVCPGTRQVRRPRVPPGRRKAAPHDIGGSAVRDEGSPRSIPLACHDRERNGGGARPDVATLSDCQGNPVNGTGLTCGGPMLTGGIATFTDNLLLMERCYRFQQQRGHGPGLTAT